MVKSSAAGYAPLSPSRSTDSDPEAAPASADPDPLLSSAISLAAREPVFSLVQRVSKDLEDAVDTPLSWDQLKSPAVNFSLVRPLVLKFTQGDRPHISLIYALLLVRAHFVERADDDLAFAAVNTARSELCELLAIKALSAYGVAPGSHELLHVLSTSFNPFAGAELGSFAPSEGVDEAELRRLDQFGKDEATNALELAVSSGAKRFLKSPLVQQVVRAIDRGDVIYTPEAGPNALLADSYKPKPVVEIYDWRERPYLDHHRLRVPRIRGRLEFATFAVMLALFLATQATYRVERVNACEALFVLWGVGFALDEWSALAANGLTTYASGAFNILDSSFCVVLFAFIGMRAVGLVRGDDDLGHLAFDTLGLAGCVLLPRLTISLLRHNVILLALSKMIRDFCAFMCLAFLTASGFLCTFRILSRGTWSVGRISWLMLKIWLGSAFLGFEAAQQFHPFFGPALMVAFAILSQTLLLTILISLLSNTFAAVQANSEVELIYQMTLRTLERAKADPLTCYVPPLNTLAFVVLVPLRFLLSPRAFHKAQVYLARTLNLPILVTLALYARFSHRRGGAGSGALALARDLPRRFGSWDIWDSKVEHVVDEVWERAVTDEARRVGSFDEGVAAGGEGREGGEGRGAAQGDDEEPAAGSSKVKPTSTGKAKAQGQGTPSPAAAAAAGRRPRPPALKPQRPPAAQRLGSLDSPLARLFGPGASLGAGPAAAAAASGAGGGGGAGGLSAGGRPSGEVEARLGRIEEALGVLLGEVIKSGGVGRGGGGGGGGAGVEGEEEERKSAPLTSLTGMVEPSYADDGDE